MKTITLNFDNEAKVNLSFFEHNYYEKVFHVTKDGVDYDWANVTEMILLVKKNNDVTTKTLELKLSENDITKTTGYMTLKLTTAKTAIAPGDYKCVELGLIFSATKPRTWWSGGTCTVKKRGIANG